MNRTSASPWVTWGLYLFAITLIISPMVDLGTTVWPTRFGDMAWRYGMLGLLAGYLHTPLLGLVLGLGVAYWQEHTGVLRLAALLSLLGVVMLLISMAAFGLDVVAMRAVRPEDERAGILVGGVLQEVKYLAAVLVLGCLWLGVSQMAKRMARSAARQEDTPGVLKRP